MVVGAEEMRGCNKDVPLAVNHSNRCGGKTANQNSSNEMRPVWKRSTLYCLGEGTEEEKETEEGAEEAQSAYFRQHTKLMSRWPLKSIVAKTSVIISSTVQNSFAKATRIRGNLKAELDCGI